MSKYEVTTDKGVYEIETDSPKPTLGEKFKSTFSMPAPIGSAVSAMIDAPIQFGRHFMNQFALGYPELAIKETNAFPGENMFARDTSDENIGGLIARRPVVGSVAALGGLLGGLKNPIFKAMGVTPASTMTRKAVAGGLTGLTFAPSKLESPEQVAGEQFTKGAFGALLPPAFAIAGKTTSKTGDMVNRIGDEILNTTLGQRLSEYGKKVGFENIPKYFTETVPREIVTKLTNFFPEATKAVGSKIDRVINSKKYSNVSIDIWDLQGTAGKMANQIDDFDISTAEKKILKSLADKLLLIGEAPIGKDLTEKQIISLSKKRWMSLPKLWELRKDVDKVIYQKTWNKPEAIDFLKQFRKLLNAPIRDSGDDIAKSFDRYSFIKDVEGELGGNFISIQDSSKNNIYSKKIAQFIESQFSSKDLPQKEVIEMLKDVERNLKPEDKIIDEMMNYAAAQQLDEPIRGIGGIVNKTLDYILGGKRGVAQKAAGIQKFQRFMGEKPGRFTGGLNKFLTGYMKKPLLRNTSIENILQFNEKSKLLKFRKGNK